MYEKDKKRIVRIQYKEVKKTKITNKGREIKTLLVIFL